MVVPALAVTIVCMQFLQEAVGIKILYLCGPQVIVLMALRQLFVHVNCGPIKRKSIKVS